MKNLFYIILSFLLLLLLYDCSEEAHNESKSIAELRYLQDYTSPDYFWGYIDQEGKETINAIYDDTRDFEEGLAAVNYKGYWGFIDLEGNYRIKPTYRSVYSFSEGYALAQTFSDTLLVLNNTGQKVLQLTYPEVFSCSSGIFRVKTKQGFIFLNIEGIPINQEIYDQAQDFENGFAIVGINEKVGVIDSGGIEILPLTFTHISILNKKYIKVLSENNRFKIYNLAQKDFYPGEYRSVLSDGVSSIAVQKEDSSWNIFDQNMEDYIIVPYPDLYSGGEGKWMYRQDGKFGLLDENGQKLTENEFDALYRYSENRCAFLKGGFWGYLDEKGKEVIPPVLPLAWDYKNGFARIIANGGIGFIDKEGNIVIPPQFVEVRDFQENMARFQKFR